MSNSAEKPTLRLTVCFGTSCFIRGAQELYARLMEYVRERGIADTAQLKVSFCTEQCKKGPVLTVNGTLLERCTIEAAIAEIEKQL